MANIKIGSVLSDVFGVTGQNLMHMLLSGQPITLSDVKNCLMGSLEREGPKQKAWQLYDAIRGYFTDHHREVLKSLFKIIGALEGEIAFIEARLSRLFVPYNDLIERLDAVPGIAYVAAWAIVAEVGPTLASFGYR